MANTQTKTEEKILITKDMTIGEVVSKYPKTVSVMLSRGLHCIGCAANPYETIENGALGHGIPQEEIEKLVTELNEVVNQAPLSKDTIHFTERAINKVKELAVAEKKIDQGLKIEAKAVGCKGWEYFMDFAEKAAEGEMEKYISGLKIFISDASLKSMLGAEVDYLVTAQGEGFKIENPNKGDCKCGTGKCAIEGCGDNCQCET